MKKEFRLIYKDGKFLITNKENSNEECFSIDQDNLQFDTKKFYEGLFIDVNEHIEIEILNGCNADVLNDANMQKKAKHVYGLINHITQEICSRLNEQCFTSESSE